MDRGGFLYRQLHRARGGLFYFVVSSSTPGGAVFGGRRGGRTLHSAGVVVRRGRGVPLGVGAVDPTRPFGIWVPLGGHGASRLLAVGGAGFACGLGCGCAGGALGRVGVRRLVSAPVKVSFQTFGCKANQYDTELLRTRLESGGGQSVDDYREADLCLVNSCSVTAKADQECRQFVRRLLRENPLARIVVTGCYASHAPEALKALSPRVEVYSNKEKEGLPACLGFEVAPEVWGLSRFAHRARAFVKVQDGCKAPCRYCIIPQTRSTYWSKPVDHVLKEVQTLADGGHGEIVFTGIRLGLYHGQSSDGKGADLTKLLARIIDLPGRFRIRLSSLEVTEVPDKLIQLAAGTDKICAHFHIPLQSADDGVLKDMGRWYRFADYEDRVSAVRRFLPEASVTADVLTGFPTESEEAFENTFRRIHSLSLSGLHAFPFSSRPGTVSADLKPLDRAVLQNRTRRLIGLSDSLKARFQARFVGTRRTALAEGNGEGWTDNYIRVTIPPDVPAGTLVLAQI